MMEDKGYGNCKDCMWQPGLGGCNVVRDSTQCNLNRKRYDKIYVVTYDESIVHKYAFTTIEEAQVQFKQSCYQGSLTHIYEIDMVNHKIKEVE